MFLTRLKGARFATDGDGDGQVGERGRERERERAFIEFVGKYKVKH